MKPVTFALFSLGLIAAMTSPGQAQNSVPPIAVFTQGARILFQGDSITDGNRGRGTDPNHILGHGYAFLISAKYGAAFAPLELEFMNRGVSGNTVSRVWRSAGRKTRSNLSLICLAY